MTNLLPFLRPMAAHKQFELLSVQRRRGKPPYAFFQMAREQNWVPSDTADAQLPAPIRPLLTESEMSSSLGIPVAEVDSRRLPFYRSNQVDGRPYTFFQSALRLLALKKQFVPRGLQRLASLHVASTQLAGQGMTFKMKAINDLLPDEGVKNPRMNGDHRVVSAVYFPEVDKEAGIGAAFQRRSALDFDTFCFFPATSDISYIIQRHEMTHARQDCYLEKVFSQEDIYDCEQDADVNSGCEYVAEGGSPAAVAAVFAMRAARTLAALHVGDEQGGYGYTPALLTESLPWSFDQAVNATWEVALGMGAKLSGERAVLKPGDMQEGVIAIRQKRKPSSSSVVGMAKALFQHQSAMFGTQEYFKRNARAAEELWFGGDKLSPDALRVLGCGLEAINLFRYGPKV